MGTLPLKTVAPSPRPATAENRGFTLAELLVASTIALGVMLAVASLFGIFSRTASTSQAIVDMATRMRAAAATLRSDLAGVTAPLSPPLSPDSGVGYFELIEGPRTDVIASGSNLVADVDDALLFTTRSIGRPFQGVVNGSSSIESHTAEVAWFCRPSQTPPISGQQLYTLYRRQLLVLGYPGPSVTGAMNMLSGTATTVYQIGSNTYDVSLRLEPNDVLANTLVPNTLSDLTQRENRFMHGPLPAVFPSGTSSPPGLILSPTTNREGDDVILTNVLSFDVKVFDPSARPLITGSVVTYPGETGYSGPTPTAFTGCMVDLGQVPAAGTLLTGAAAARSQLTATYDTWSTLYERNGINEDNDSEDLNGNNALDLGEDQNGNGVFEGPPATSTNPTANVGGLIDEGSNGLDDNADGAPDDLGELETAPPYATPLRAIEIRIRCYDPISREVRQTTVRHTFIP